MQVWRFWFQAVRPVLKGFLNSAQLKIDSRREDKWLKMIQKKSVCGLVVDVANM